MNKDCENRYKICRNNAGFTQEQAAEFLNVATRTLSDYENGKTTVPDTIVASMAEHYRAPVLAWWHLKTTSVLGKFLPEIIMPVTNGDMALLAILAQDELADAIRGMKRAMPDLKLEDDYRDEFRVSISLIKKAYGKLFSIVAHAEQIEADVERKKSA
jgi:DNA-binding XRE family transcriptional regulator